MIETSTLDFLKQLQLNNNKLWFDANRSSYEQAKANVIQLIDKIISEISRFDKGIKNLTAKECMFRINRDVRFSNNKAPYKNNIGASINPGGKKSFSAGYYIHIQPGESFIAGGMWQPPSPQINAIRQEIDYNAKEFKKIIGAKDFIKQFGKLSEEDKLKSAPKGYEKEHPEIELLKYKSYIVVHNFTDKEIKSKDFTKLCVEIIKAIYPLNAFLRRACD